MARALEVTLVNQARERVEADARREEARAEAQAAQMQAMVTAFMTNAETARRADREWQARQAEADRQARAQELEAQNKARADEQARQNAFMLELARTMRGGQGATGHG